MKFNCGETLAEKKRLGQRHRWFAWYPVRVGSHDCRWLETVERRCERPLRIGWLTRYRALSKKTKRPLGFKERIITDALVELEKQGYIAFTEKGAK